MKRFLIVFFVLGLILFSPATVFAYYTNMPAIVVIGQTDFSSATSGLTQTTFTSIGPYSVSMADGKLAVLDNDGSPRILIYNSIPSTNGAAASVVVGQDDFTSGSSGVSQTRFSL